METSTSIEACLTEFELKVSQTNEMLASMRELIDKMRQLIQSETAATPGCCSSSRLGSKSRLERFGSGSGGSASDTSDIVKFNIGGTVFTTCRSTIAKRIRMPNSSELYEPNLLEAAANGLVDAKLDDSNAIFIDRDPLYFTFVLNYLRTVSSNERFALPKNSDACNLILKEAEFFRIGPLIDLFRPFTESRVLSAKQSRELMELCGFTSSDQWKLLYQASSNGFSAINFHTRCDNVPRTLVVIKTTGPSSGGGAFIFGGYTEQTWDQSASFKQDPNAFLFSLCNRDNAPVKLKLSNANGNSIYCKNGYGPTFGGGHDFFIADNSNVNLTSYSNLGHAYKHPSYAYNTSESKSFLAGSYNFQTAEVEVYCRV